MDKAMLAALAFVAAALSGCTPRPPSEYPKDLGRVDPRILYDFRLRVFGTQPVAARVEGPHVTGPQIMLSRYDGPKERSLRGWVYQRPVNVSVTKDGARGSVGSSPLQVSVSLDDDVLRVRGLVRGHLTSFQLDGDRLQGRIGQCAYDLVRVGRDYQGKRNCDSARTDVVAMQIPYELARWDPPETAAVLSVLLSKPPMP